VGRLEGKAAVITGGASGIGRAAVELFVAEGARVLVADIQDDKSADLTAALGPAVLYRYCDVTCEADVKGAIDAALEAFGRLDVMFNNAGRAGVIGGIAEIPVAGFDDTMALLLRSVFLGMKHAAPVMRDQGAGSIISTASIAGIDTEFGPHVYNAAKAAVIHLTRSVAKELGEDGVRVNCICPGYIATSIFGDAVGLSRPEADATVAAAATLLAGRQPIARAGLPHDIAQAALWLAGEESAFVTGHALVVDGGVTGGRAWSEVKQRRQEMFANLSSARDRGDFRLGGND
jgi:NAD(P)-dependent dehydrogenase (short-subunit alcohol dehydrogenase family)